MIKIISKHLPSPHHRERRERQRGTRFTVDINGRNFNWRHPDDKWVSIKNISAHQEIPHAFKITLHKGVPAPPKASS